MRPPFQVDPAPRVLLVNVSVPAKVANVPVVGNVKVVAPVAVKVVLNAPAVAKVELFANVSAAAVPGLVIVTLLIEAAVAAPIVGVTKVGLVDNTTLPVPVLVVVPVPPCATDKAVVSPVRLVMSLLAPFAAAPRLVLAPAAVVAPVPPLATATTPVTLAELPVILLSVKAIVLVAPL